MTSWSSSIKNWFLQAYSIYALLKKNVMALNRNAKIYAIGETGCNEI